jgi:hypothetical protein
MCVCVCVYIDTYIHTYIHTYEGVSKSFRTGSLERELQVVQFFATRCSRIAILCVSLVSFTAITLRVAFQRVFIFVFYFVIDSVRKLLDTTSYVRTYIHIHIHVHTYIHTHTHTHIHEVFWLLIFNCVDFIPFRHKK